MDRIDELNRRLARMLANSVAGQVLGKNDSTQAALDLIWEHPQVLVEVQELLDVLGRAPGHVHTSAIPGIPLQVHSQYTRLEILAAVGEGSHARTPEWREGVDDAKSVGADLLAFTLDKTSGDFSPTTRYRDYAISPELIHWESQSGLRAASPTGLRYQHHVSMERRILLFARTRADERAFWFLGPAKYVKTPGRQTDGRGVEARGSVVRRPLRRLRRCGGLAPAFAGPGRVYAPSRGPRRKTRR